MALDNDPVLGAVVANYPSDRARLLRIGGALLLVIWLLVTAALLNVEEQLAAVLTVLIVGSATMVVGWYIAHLWNREVVLYERGFSYREGSYNAFILYNNIISVRQLAERRAYFGGLIRRTVFRFTVKTSEDEIIILNNIYKRVEELGTRLEQQSLPAIRALMARALGEGKRFPFGDALSVGADGLYAGQRALAWTAYTGLKIQHGRLQIFSGDTVWLALPLETVDNLLLLLETLRQHHQPTP